MKKYYQLNYLNHNRPIISVIHSIFLYIKKIKYMNTGCLFVCIIINLIISTIIIKITYLVFMIRLNRLSLIEMMD